MTYVTCPTFRYHPAVVAQKAATMQLLSEGRFRLGLGSGENLNEHVVGGGWPPVNVRHEMFEEAVAAIRALFEGGHVTHHGTHFVRPEDAAGAIPCGDNIDDFVQAVRPYIDAGFTDVALVRIGGQTQHQYLDWSAKMRLPRHSG